MLIILYIGLPAFYATGNHDIGMFTGPPHLIDWWTHNFGPLNQAYTIGNVSFIVLATPLLEDPTAHEKEAIETSKFIETLGEEIKKGKCNISSL